MLLCSCLDCQRATGTGHAAIAIVKRADVSVEGEHAGFARPADSGAILTRSFCAACGTPLFAASSRAPGSLLLPVGLFGADSAWFEPRHLIFARSHHAWDNLDPGVVPHETYPPPRTDPGRHPPIA